MKENLVLYYRGIFLANLAVLCYALIDVTFKWLSADFHFSQIMFFRFLFGLIIMLTWVIPRGMRNVCTGRHWGLHTCRLIFMLIAVTTSILAIKSFLLADYTVLSFTYAFFVVLLSIVFLSEKIGIHRSLAILIGFIGVLFVIQPTKGSVSLGGLFALISAFCYAVTAILTKKLSKTESPTTMTFYYTVMGLIVMAFISPFYWTSMTLFDLFLLFLVAALGTICHLSLAQSYRYIPPYIASFFDYGAIIWAVIFGYLIWYEIPTSGTLLGATIVISSAIYIFIRERAHQNKTQKLQLEES